MRSRLFLRILISAIALLATWFGLIGLFINVVRERYMVLGQPGWMLLFLLTNIAVSSILVLYIIWRPSRSPRAASGGTPGGGLQWSASFVACCLLVITLSAQLYFAGDYLPQLGNAELGALPHGGKAVYKDVRNGDKSQLGRLGAMLMESQQYQKAFFYLKAGADRGDAKACLCLGLMYDQGLGVPGNVDKAIEWMTTAVKKGYPGAQAALASSNSYQSRLVLEQKRADLVNEIGKMTGDTKGK